MSFRRAGRICGRLRAVASWGGAHSSVVRLTLMLALIFGVPCHAQISPGPLARPHQSLSGPSGCTQCHAVSARSPNFRCLDCHREIAARIEQHRGLHATFVAPGTPSSACVKCHSDHNGEDFTPIRWTPSLGSFDHTKAGFALTGKHSGLECRSCHTAQEIGTTERSLLRTKDLNHTFLGLSQTCTACHEDKHQGHLGPSCLQCHSTASWKAAQNFDHNKARYPLTGAHQQVSCQKCHTPGPDGAARFAGLQFSHCSSCHSDPHHGSFQQTCESCHSTRTWKQSSVLASFDHARTSFPLLGQHAEIKCEACHKGADFRAPITHALCTNCHKDEHNGQFLKRPDGGRCESCHTVEGFRPAKFTLADHNVTGFQLRGKHASLACAQCHAPAGKDTLFKMKFALCTDCHKDAHFGQFAAAPHLNHCEHCHTELTFRPSTMTLARHQQGSFPLTGSHQAIACIDCHQPMAASKAVAYHFASLSCETCHKDPHAGEFAARMARTSAGGQTLGCQVCHSTKTWKDLSSFDHATTSFALKGTHRAVACAECHRPPNMEQTMLHVSFKAAPSLCEDCHENIHGPQFATTDKVTRCAACHTAVKWTPSLFDHERTKFSLQGAHTNVKCGACHTRTEEIAGKVVLLYKPTPTACSSCHGSTMGRLTQPTTFIGHRHQHSSGV